MPAPARIMLVAGEPSGDQHGAKLVTVLQGKQKDFSFQGMGMGCMEAAGVKLIADATDTAVNGLFEVIRYYPKIKRKLGLLKKALEHDPPDLLVLIDYPEFNLILAETAHRLGIKTLFYISPQVWAWRRGRVKKIARIIDAMAVILPFEEQFYQHTSLAVHYVGHPLVDEAYAHHILPQPSPAPYQRNHVPRKILLLPGSRQSEIKRLLPVLCGAAQHLQQQHAELQFELLVAPGIDADRIRHYLHIADFNCTLANDHYAAMQRADLAITSSGTVTLQLALCGTPMVVIYRLNHLSYFLARILVRIPHIALPNILAGKAIVPELIQYQATAGNIEKHASAIMRSAERRHAMRQDLHRVANSLGPSGTSQRVAELVCSMT